MHDVNINIFQAEFRHREQRNNKSDKEKLKINEQEYFIITLSGQLFITNGNSN